MPHYTDPMNIKMAIHSIPEGTVVFSELFSFEDHALVNFVGGGGKTALIHRLMDEYSEKGPGLCTTTTRIHPPDHEKGFSVISGDNTVLIKNILTSISRNCADRPYKIVAARHFMSPHLMRGVEPDFADDLEPELFPVIFNEADGAAGFSLKIPRENEPVLMNKAKYLVPVIGIDCLHQPMGPGSIFRWQECSGRLSLKENEPITAELASTILMHSSGVCKNWKAGTTIIPFINKVDDPAKDSDARELARFILRNPNFPVERVLYGSVLRGTVALFSSI
jgi:probable selenium-dependent hydroxylase accessory protein YqeC